jgi:ankyrin repeat protein
LVLVFNGHYQCLAYLIQPPGIPVDSIENGGLTLLHIATEKGHEKCVELLLKRGADPMIPVFSEIQFL